MRVYRSTKWSFVIPVLCIALALAGCAPAGGSTAMPTVPAAIGTLTFGSEDCGQLVAMEEVQSITTLSPNLLNVVEEGTCAFEDASGNPIITVIVTRGAGQDCSGVGTDAEMLSSLGDTAAWGPTSRTGCIVRGDTRAQVVLGTGLPSGVDARTAMIALLTAAAARLP